MNIFYEVFLLAFDIKIYLLKEENKMKFIKFLSKHWIVSLIVVVVVFAVVLPNLEALAISRGSSLVQLLLGGN